MSQSSLGSSPADSVINASPVGGEPRVRQTKKQVAGQFVKFCVVGFSSTIISLSVLYFVLNFLHIERVLNNALAGYPSLQTFVAANHLYLQVAGTFGFLFGVTNGFFWNSRWTFPQKDKAKRKAQYFRFFAVNISGLILNWFVTWVLIQVLAAKSPGDGLTWQKDVAIFGSIVIVAFWNFTINKFWTFRHQ